MSGPPAAVPPTAHSPSRLRRGPWLVLSIVWALLVCAIGVPVAYLVAPIVLGTAEAGRGAPSPGAALLGFVYTFEDADPNSDVGVARWVVPQRRSQILAQRRDYLRLMDADRNRGYDIGRFESAAPAGAPSGDTVSGDRATAVGWYRVVAVVHDNDGDLFWTNGPSLQWRAEARRDSAGWRLWSVTIPPWCGTGGYSRCGAA